MLVVPLEPPVAVVNAVLTTATTWLAVDDATPDATLDVANTRTPTAETELVAVAVPPAKVVRSVADVDVPAPEPEPVRSAFRSPENRRSDS